MARTPKGSGGASSSDLVSYVRNGYSSRFSENVDVTTVEEALDQIFQFSSLPPSLVISGSPAFGLREYGDNIINPTITATAGLGQNPQGTLTLLEWFRGGLGGTLISSQVNPLPATGYPVTDTFTVVDDQVYTVRVTDDQARQTVRTGLYDFVYPFYWGVVDEATDLFDGMTRANILALGGLSLQITTPSDKAVTTSPTNARYCFMYPAVYGALTSIIDKNGFETLPDYDIFTYDVIGLDSTSQSYRIYVLKNDTTQVNFLNTYKF
jgi:hypothetical protein